MAIKELTPEQIRTMTLEEKDRWWLENVYKGDMPQLNLRSAITGMLLGCILTATNLYIGIRSGWSLGVGITSVVVSYAIFRVFAILNIGKEMTILENNAMQSIATSAGYMSSPLIASIPAYMMVTNQVLPMWQVIPWVICLSILGVLFAFPLKKRFINDEQLPFPEGYAAGIVMDSLHGEDGKEGAFKAILLSVGGFVSAVIEFIRSKVAMASIHLDRFVLPEHWDEFVYKYVTPKLWGTPLQQLTIQWDSSIIMAGTGGLMNMKTAMSILLGAILNYFVLAPWLIHQGIIPEAKFKAITMWSMWAGAAMMTTSSLYGFFSKPKILIEAFSKMFKKKGDSTKEDILKDIELPMSLFFIGIPIFGGLTVYMGHVWFGIDIWLGLLAIPLVFIFTLIAVTSTGLTAITPGSALGKLTQITYSALAPGNVTTNLMTAGITSEVSTNASNLLMDVKPGYMLGGKPRHQAVGHVLGVIAGAFVSVPLFYLMFHGDISLFTSEAMPMPGAMIWKGVAEALTKGFSALHPTAQLGALVGAFIGILFEVLNQKTKGRFPLSGVGLGLGFVLRFHDSFSMALGTFFFWLMGRLCKNKEGLGYRSFVMNQETVAAGVIAGGAIVGIILVIIETAAS